MDNTWTLVLENDYIKACRLIGMSVGLASICKKQFGDTKVYSVATGRVQIFIVKNDESCASSFSFPFRPDDEIIAELVAKCS